MIAAHADPKYKKQLWLTEPDGEKLTNGKIYHCK